MWSDGNKFQKNLDLSHGVQLIVLHILHTYLPMDDPSSFFLVKYYFIVLDSFNPAKSDEPETSEEILQKAIDEVVAKQLDLGLDIVNDGEIARETYFSHFVKRIKGMNPDNVVDKKIRNGEL